MASFGAKVRDIPSVEAWDALVKDSLKQEVIIVVDVYKDWCGPCTVMQFFFDQLVLNGEQIEERVYFRSVRF